MSRSQLFLDFIPMYPTVCLAYPILTSNGHLKLRISKTEPPSFPPPNCFFLSFLISGCDSSDLSVVLAKILRSLAVQALAHSCCSCLQSISRVWPFLIPSIAAFLVQVTGQSCACITALSFSMFSQVLLLFGLLSTNHLDILPKWYLDSAISCSEFSDSISFKTKATIIIVKNCRLIWSAMDLDFISHYLLPSSLFMDTPHNYPPNLLPLLLQVCSNVTLSVKFFLTTLKFCHLFLHQRFPTTIPCLNFLHNYYLLLDYKISIFILSIDCLPTLNVDYLKERNIDFFTH